MTEAAPPLTTFRDLCIDAVDARGLASFWAAVLGTEAEAAGATDAMTTVDGVRVWFNTVPEARSVKHRVHLDVRLEDADVAGLHALGARMLQDRAEDRHWQVWADPEGGEFCVMHANHDRPEYGRATGAFEMVVDCGDAHAQGRWWQRMLGGRLESRPDAPWCWLEDVPGLPLDYLVFVPVPEPKTAKNRVHWDVHGDLETVLAAGARLLRRRDEQIRWHVMADPEGNEFCLFPPTTDEAQ